MNFLREIKIEVKKTPGFINSGECNWQGPGIKLCDEDWPLQSTGYLIEILCFSFFYCTLSKKFFCLKVHHYSSSNPWRKGLAQGNWPRRQKELQFKFKNLHSRCKSTEAIHLIPAHSPLL